MTLEDLRVFITVYETGNLSAVARALRCTQSAVSQHVKRLELETGLALIERQPRGVVPTQAGRVLYQAATAGLASVDAALRQLGELRDGRGGTVSITTGGVTVRQFMTDAITTFRRRHPDVTLQFRSAYSSRQCAELLHAGQADLAWITLGLPLTDIQQRPVTSLPWLLVVRADDPLAARTSIDPSELTAIRYIAYPEGSASRQRLEENLVRLGISRPEPAGVADWDTAILLAELGIGHVILPALPRLVISPASPLRTIPIPALDPLAVGWAAREWDALSPPASEFAALVTARQQSQSAVPAGRTHPAR